MIKRPFGGIHPLYAVNHAAADRFEGIADHRNPVNRVTRAKRSQPDIRKPRRRIPRRKNIPR